MNADRRDRTPAVAATRAVAVVIAIMMMTAACSPAATQARAVKHSATNPRPPSLATTTTVSNVSTHEIGDLDGDGKAELVEIHNPDSSLTSVRLRLSRGLVCDHFPSPDANFLVLVDIIGSTDLAGPGSRELWIALEGNEGGEVALAHLDGCNLRYLRRDSSVLFYANTYINGRLCCRAAVASIRCIAHPRWVELVIFTASPTEGPMATGPDSNALPFTLNRERLRVEHDQLVTLSHQEGHTPRRDALPPRLLENGLDCLGLHSS